MDPRSSKSFSTEFADAQNGHARFGLAAVVDRVQLQAILLRTYRGTVARPL
ncbi:hypothetical protein [Parasulfitobacter algicola]|uniref:Transposase n=1 Tax=Parasulfitobacter algicola TaxID=2614809 RepID=A0ABX2J160_9RHOB|nr:hypothetical protein [Sulfitobacter algicola]NSX56953.1 hypothetical protein [Sulfitobacter algicola]